MNYIITFFYLRHLLLYIFQFAIITPTIHFIVSFVLFSYVILWISWLQMFLNVVYYSNIPMVLSALVSYIQPLYKIDISVHFISFHTYTSIAFSNPQIHMHIYIMALLLNNIVNIALLWVLNSLLGYMGAVDTLGILTLAESTTLTVS